MTLLDRNRKMYKEAIKKLPKGHILCSKCGTIMSAKMLNLFQWEYTADDYAELDIPQRKYKIQICRHCTETLNNYLLNKWFKGEY